MARARLPRADKRSGLPSDLLLSKKIMVNMNEHMIVAIEFAMITLSRGLIVMDLY